MRAILYKDGVEIRRVSDYTKITRTIKKLKLEDGLEWKLLVDGVKPAHSTLEYLVRSEVDNNEFHPTYADLKVIQEVWTPTRKSDSQIIAELESKHDNIGDNLIEKVIYLGFFAGIIDRKIDGLTITPEMQITYDAVKGKLTKLWQNKLNLDNKLQELADGQDPDHNTGWQE